MTQAKYFQKLKCECGGIKLRLAPNKEVVTTLPHIKCNGSGIIKGADITSTIKPILEGIDKEIRISYSGKYFYKKSKQIIEENVIKVE